MKYEPNGETKAPKRGHERMWHEEDCSGAMRVWLKTYSDLFYIGMRQIIIQHRARVVYVVSPSNHRLAHRSHISANSLFKFWPKELAFYLNSYQKQFHKVDNSSILVLHNKK